MIVQDNYLKRSHVSYSWRSLLQIYLIVASITLPVVAGVYFSEPNLEIICVAKTANPASRTVLNRNHATQETGRFSTGFIGFVRLLPVSDQAEAQTKPPSEPYSFQCDYRLRTSYCRIFSEGDLMSRLVMGTIYYRIYR